MEELSKRQMTAVDLIVQGKPDGVVAKELGVTPRLVQRWRAKNPRFQKHLAWALEDPAVYRMRKAFLVLGKALMEKERRELELGSGDPEVAPLDVPDTNETQDSKETKI